MHFRQTSVDWNNPESSRYSHTRIEAKRCIKEDFGESERAEFFFNSWTGFSIVCPQLKVGQTFEIKGDAASMKADMFKFVINRCDDE